jgi:hypothetical protein
VPLRGPSGNRPRERSGTSGGGLVALLDMEGGDLAAGGLPPAGELLTENIGSLRELAATKSASRSLRTYLNIKYYIVILLLALTRDTAPGRAPTGEAGRMLPMAHVATRRGTWWHWESVRAKQTHCGAKFRFVPAATTCAKASRQLVEGYI